MKINHSYLFVPANEKMLSKIPYSNADAFIIDLEDSVLEAQKDSALKSVCAFMDSYKCKKPIYVRINQNRVKTEIQELCETNINGYMIPKVEHEKDIIQVSDLDKKPVIALIETPLGIVNVYRIVKNETVFALAFGAEDYSEICEIKNEHENLIYQKGRLVNYSRTYNKIAIDTISLNIRDTQKYRTEAQKTKDIGFNAKLAIHPMQVDVINSVYNDFDIKELERIVFLYRSSNKSVVEIDGKLYEKPHIEAIERKILSMKG